MYCGDCRNECDQVLVDMGIGHYEFWGRRGVDTCKQWVSNCCEAIVYHDEALTIEEDNVPDPEADRADAQYDEERENDW